MKLKVAKRAFVHEILEEKELCQFYLFGTKCKVNCGICSVKEWAEKARMDFNNRANLGHEGRKAFFKIMLKILAHKNTTGKVLAGIENMDQMLLFACLEQLRNAAAIHIRGCRLNTAPRLETLLTFFKQNLDGLKFKESSKIFETKLKQTSAFNDDNVGQPDCARQHLIHSVLDFTAGYYSGQVNMGWIKKGWEDDDTAEILSRAECIKRKVKHRVFNQETRVEFSMPEFDAEQMTYTSSLIHSLDEKNTNKPLAPNKGKNRTLIL